MGKQEMRYCRPFQGLQHGSGLSINNALCSICNMEPATAPSRAFSLHGHAGDQEMFWEREAKPGTVWPTSLWTRCVCFRDCAGNWKHGCHRKFCKTLKKNDKKKKKTQTSKSGCISLYQGSIYHTKKFTCKFLQITLVFFKKMHS